MQRYYFHEKRTRCYEKKQVLENQNKSQKINQLNGYMMKLEKSSTKNKKKIKDGNRYKIILKKDLFRMFHI